MIEVGQEAPDFRLRDQDGEEASLSDFRGRRVLLVFYPLDFSPVCSDQLSIYQEVKLGIDTRLLADFEPKGEVARAYGAYIEERGHSNRSLVLIDEEGIVEWVHESPSPLEVPGANLIFDALAA
jgi:peroxiredoxin (alkyl hydroperoxide reductase subunit C)